MKTFMFVALFLFLLLPKISVAQDQIIFTDIPTVLEDCTTELSIEVIPDRLIALGAKKRMGEKLLIVDPNSHTWKAFSANGKLLRTGLATAGSRYCPDIGKPCKTKSGIFRVYSLGDAGCYSKKFPVGRGGAPMPYCMFFNGGQAIHGSHEVVAGNISHGCVRVRVTDARWLRFNFINVGTKIHVKSY